MTSTVLTSHSYIANRGWRALARAAWLGLVGLILASYFADIGSLWSGSNPGTTAWNVVMPLGFVLIGGAIFWRKSNDWMALLTSFALIGMGVYLLTGASDDLILRPGWRAATSVLQGLTSGSFVLLAFLFPDGRLAPLGARPLVIALLAVDILGFVVIGLAGWPAALELSGFWLAMAVAIVLQVYRYYRVSGAMQRQQTKWVVAGLFSPLLITINYFLIIMPNQAALAAGGWLGPLTILEIVVALLLPLSIAISILRYRLWDIDILINRAVVYGSLTLLLALGYLGAVVILQAVFQVVAGQASSALVTVLSTLLIAAIAAPLRRRLQSAIDRRFYRRRYDAALALESFAASLRDNVDLDHLSSRLVGVVDETMEPAQVSLWIKP